MKELIAKHQDDVTRGFSMFATGLIGWLVQNQIAVELVAKLAVAALTCVALLIQVALAVHKHFKKD